MWEKRLQLLSRDLRRVADDAFALEQRLDQGLEEERLNQQASQERLDQQASHERLDETLQEAPEGLEGAWREPDEDLPTSTEVAQRDEDEDDDEEEEAKAWSNSNGASFLAQQHEDAAEITPPQREFHDEGGEVEDGMAGVSATPDQGGGGGGDSGAASEQEVDFVGEDEEDNVWQ